MSLYPCPNFVFLSFVPLSFPLPAFVSSLAWPSVALGVLLPLIMDPSFFLALPLIMHPSFSFTLPFIIRLPFPFSQVRTRDECFLDLSLDISQNSSLTHCLRNFSSTELLSGDSKYFCETCCSEQEAQKRYVSSDRDSKRFCSSLTETAREDAYLLDSYIERWWCTRKTQS